MRMIAARDIKRNPAVLYQDDQYKIITANNRPQAFCIPLGDFADIEDLLADFRRFRAMRALESFRTLAAAKGLDSLTMEEIDEEIRRTRSTHKGNE